MKKESFPVKYLRDKYLFPRCSIEIPAQIGNDVTIAPGNRVVVLPAGGFLSLLTAGGRIATFAEVTREIEGRDVPTVELRGDRRVRVCARGMSGRVYIEEIEPGVCDGFDELADRLRKKAQQFVFLINIAETDRLIYLMNFIHGIRDIADFISHYFIIDNKKKKILFRTIDPCARGELLENFLDEMIARLGRNNTGGRR